MAAETMDPAYRALLEDERQVLRQRHLRFGYRAGGVGFLVRRGLASEVLSGPPVYPFPRMPPALIGLLNLRGNIVPVFDLPGLITGNRTPRNHRFLLVLDRDPRAVAVPVDGLPVTLDRLTPSAGVLACPEPLHPFLRGVRISGRQIWHELDHDSLFRRMARG